jgi:hypothetical protein
MKRFLLVLGMVIGCTGVSTVNLALAGKVHHPVFLNQAGANLSHLYISPIDKNLWDETLIDNYLTIGESIKVNFSPSEKTCKWDLMGRIEDGGEIIWQNVDLCTNKMLILHYRNGKAWVTKKGEPPTPPKP